jgi:hypothetical protein
MLARLLYYDNKPKDALFPALWLLFYLEAKPWQFYR